MFFLEFALESSLLVLMVLGIRKIFTGKIRYAGIYALWFLVMLRFMIPVNIISTPLSVGGIIPETLSSQVGSDVYQSSTQQTTGMAGGAENYFLNGKSIEESRIGEVESYGDSALMLRGAGQRQENSLWDRFRSINWHLLLTSVWLIISGLLLLWFGISNLCLTKKLKRSRVLYGTKGTLKIYTTLEVKNPCLYGFLRPAIYLPEGLFSGDSGLKVSEEEIEQMITHEYVHYLHKDHIWAMIRVLLVSVYWFDPFLWIAVSCFKKDAELFCDETVIRLIGEKQRFCYGKMLIRLAGEAGFGEFRYPIMSMSRRGKEMAKRIHAISHKKRYSRWLILPLVSLVIIAVGITCSTKSSPSAGETRETKGAETGNAASGTALDREADQEENTSQNSDVKDKGKISANYFMTADAGSANQISQTDRNAIEETFEQYIQTFTDAVNTGNTDTMYRVLSVESDVYGQQCEMAKNYYKRGIRERILACSISSLEAVSSTQVTITSKEKIKVYYADTDAKVIKQKYQYTCERIGQKWMITKMDEIAQ